jgi:type IX secretion system PorP/SprF family membrane protein
VKINRIFSVVFALLIPMMGFTQNSLDFRQFYFNPFLFNPAYAGSNGYIEFGLAHRQQWIDFEDSPVASGFSVQYPAGQRISLGFNFYTQKAVAMRTTSTQFAFAYAIPISSNQSLRLAFSGGLGIDDLDLEGRDYSNDPLILDAAQNRVSPAGSFGLVYSIGELKLGFALPTLFNQQQTGSGVLRTHPMEQLINQLYSVRYKIDLKDERFSIEPYFLYRLNRDFQNYWEMAGILHFEDRLLVGASYQQYAGAAFFFGISFLEKFKISYNYEVPRSKYTASGSHEFQLSMQLRERNTSKQRND